MFKVGGKSKSVCADAGRLPELRLTLEASMGKSDEVKAMLYGGIDVSAATLAVAVQREGSVGCEQREFANSEPGHRLLVGWLHAAEGSRSTSACVRRDLKRAMADLQKRIKRLRARAVAVIAQDPELKRKFEHLTGMPGIAEASAIQLLAELGGLDPEMTVRQWTAHSGLDPAHRISGTSVHLPSRISRHGNRYLRRALYMPALVAVRWDPHLKAFYHLLLSRHKSKLQALIAVARKILHALFGIFKTNTPYNGATLLPELKTVSQTTLC
jgi:hypothetical protein